MEDYLVASNNDWDLEAIIRGAAAAVQLPPPPQDGSGLGFEGFGFGFGFEEAKVVNELEEMCKPFVGGSSCSSDLDDSVKTKDNFDLGVEDHVQPRSSSKRRKSKQKIVREVHRGVREEDGVAMDKWNWRKYGQKAIKGSPYPRSYYRCSSSAGCHARKHVEQSKDDGHTCIVTYIAEHSHLPPTRRHAQAGRKITKFASSSSSSKPALGSPSPPSTSTMTTWSVSGPSIGMNGADYSTPVAGGSDSNGLEDVMNGMFGGEYVFDQDFSWEFDPFFTASIC